MSSNGGVRRGSKSGVIYRQTAPESRPSGLATLSVYAGVLSFLGLIGVGGVVAVVAGNAALKRIRLSGGRLTGRKAARLGRLLGYVHLAALPVAVAAYLAWNATSPSSTPAVAPADSHRAGVKSRDQLDENDRAIVQKVFGPLDPANGAEPAEEIVAAYFADRPSIIPEVALLTSKRIEHSDGNSPSASFLLKDLDTIEISEDRGDENRPIADDPTREPDLRRYSLKIKHKNKQTIWIKFTPASAGPTFKRFLSDAFDSAKVKDAPPPGPRP